MKTRLLLIYILLFGSYLYVQAQIKDTAKKVTATTPATSPKKKEIKKIDDPVLALPAELIYKIQHLHPDSILNLNERIVRNERRADDVGDVYEVTVTVRLGFSQDMITGIVKEVPLYQSADREMNLIEVKIPVKFCCTTKIDSAHTKKHCGKMSELNDFEENEHCKNWMQDNGESAGDPDAVNGFRPKVVKKSTAKPNVADSTGFGKPGQKPTKKELKNQKQESRDSSGVEKKEPIQKTKKEPAKKEKTEPVKKEANAEAEEGFGKPAPKSKGKEKNKKQKEPADTTTVQ